MFKAPGIKLNLNNRLVIQDKLLIRRFGPSDRNALRQLCSDTAFMGRPVEIFLKDRDLFADWATVYYTDYEPESIFLAECDKRIVGYIMGCLKEKECDRIFSRELYPKLLRRSLNSLLLEPSSRALLFNLGRSFLRGEFKRPDFSKIYPAHLHINVDSGFRGSGIGSGLLNKFMNYLVSRGVKAVRLATISKKANRFFEKSHFGLLYRKRMTYFDYLLQEKLYLSIYGKML